MAVVDWDAAADVAVRMVPAGPTTTAPEASQAVAELTELAAAAVQPVRETTGMVADVGEHRAAIVDRPEWIRSNVTGMRELLLPLEDRLDKSDAPSWLPSAAGRVSALEFGLALSWVATKVLGQYEAVVAPGSSNRLLLVAPNIVATERQLEVPPRDFRMWVALHEETHRVQFGAVPWLEAHFRTEIESLLLEMETAGTDALKRLAAAVVAVIKVLGGAPGATIIDAIQTPAQREIFLRLTALMSLLEGHADFVMDAAGPEIIPSLPQIRARFDHRRQSPSARDGLIRRLLGMDAKLKQYSDGRRFVAEVVAETGMSGFNRVWESPQMLPSADEIADPARWLARTGQ